MTLRTAPVTAAVLAVAALSLMIADPPAASAGVRIVSPAAQAVVPAGPVPVRLAVRDARGLQVSVDQHDITDRLRGADRRKTAVLRGARVKSGAHWLVVRWRAAGGGARMLTRRFMVARRERSLVAKVAPRAAVHSTSGVVRLRLKVRRGVGLMRAWVNGRRVRVPHSGRLWPATTLRLGARHGLHFGRNRIRVLAHHFRRARYDRETWTVRVRRTRPLAAGIAHHHAEAGGRAVRLDGRGARPTAVGRKLNWRWRIVRRPRGSKARLAGRSSPRPRLRVDVPGRYTLVQRISEHRAGGRGAARAAAIATTAQRVTVVGDTNATPLGAALTVDLTPSARGGGSITVDAKPSAGPISPADCPTPATTSQRCVFPMPFPDEDVYLVVLDAVTLEAKAFGPVGSGCPRDFDLHRFLDPWVGKNVIAILASGASCQYRTLPPTIADFSRPFTAVFTPASKPDLGIRSGWYSVAPTGDATPAEISGFLQKSWPVGHTQASQQYQFVPGGYVPFDTNKGAAPAGQNTIVVAGKEYTSQLPAGATDGFQVLVLDKTLTPMLGTPTAFANGAPVGDMANLLQRARTTPGVSTVFVQSIGRPNPYSVSANDAWNSAAQELENLGGNTDVFLTLKGADWPRPAGTTGWFSLVAAPDPLCLPSSGGPCDSETEASTPLTGEDGDLSGVLGRNQRWQYVPLMDEAGGDAGGDLLTLAYQPPQTWKFSDAASRPVLDYLANFKDGARDLRPLADDACYDPGQHADVRSSYCNIDIDWAALHSDLGDSSTGEGVCGHYPGAGVVPVSAQQYASVCDQIALETEWLGHVRNSMLNAKQKALSEQALTAYMAVQSLSTTVKSEVESGQAKANHNVWADVLGLTGETLELYSLFIPEPGSIVGEFLAGAVALAGEVTSVVEGDEQGESAVDQPTLLDPGKLGTEMENRLSAAGAAFDHSWDMIVSDPVKLETAYERFALKGGIWNTVPDSLDNSKPMIQNGVRHWAAGKFMAATYDVWMVDTKQGAAWVARDVGPQDVHTIGCDRLNNYGNTVTWAAFYRMPQQAAYSLKDRLGLTAPKQPTPVPLYASNIWVLAQGDLSAAPRAGHYSDGPPPRFWPPASLLSDLYAKPQTEAAGGGYGWERPWLYSRGQRFNIHGSGWTTQRCYWFAQDRTPYEN